MCNVLDLPHFLLGNVELMLFATSYCCSKVFVLESHLINRVRSFELLGGANHSDIGILEKNV